MSDTNVAVNTDLPFTSWKMGVSSLNKETGKREPVGSVDVMLPTLATLGIIADELLDGDEVVLNDEGLPVYAEDEYNYLQDALTAAVKAKARNALKSGTADLKAGFTISQNWDDLTAEVVRSGGGAGLVVYNEMKRTLQAWVASLGKSVKAQEAILSFCTNKNMLATADASTKGKIQGYIAEFADSLDGEQATKFEKYLVAIVEACDADGGVDELEDF